MAGIPPDDFFWTIHSGLPREGPGDDESTAKAFAMVPDLPAHPRILDIACGPGMQTLALARLGDGPIIAVDTHRPFLDELDRRAKTADVADRITTIKASMAALPFAPGSFDLIWCEGALYMLDIEIALDSWRPLLTPRGTIAATHPCWLTPDPPEAARAAWDTEGFIMSAVDGVLPRIATMGYRTIGHFVLPAASWWAPYYAPMAARLPSLRKAAAGDPSAETRLAEAESEIALWQRHGDSFGYVFLVMQRTR